MDRGGPTIRRLLKTHDTSCSADGPPYRIASTPGSLGGIDRGYTIGRGERDACDSPFLNSAPGSAGNRSDPMSPSRSESIDTLDTPPRGSSTSPSSPSAMGTIFIGTALERRRGGLPDGARAQRRGRRSSWGTLQRRSSRLGRLARERLRMPVWSESRSPSGETTTKDLLHGCLASTFRVAANERSFTMSSASSRRSSTRPDSTSSGSSSKMGARGAGHITLFD